MNLFSPVKIWIIHLTKLHHSFHSTTVTFGWSGIVCLKKNIGNCIRRFLLPSLGMEQQTCFCLGFFKNSISYSLQWGKKLILIFLMSRDHELSRGDTSVVFLWKTRSHKLSTSCLHTEDAVLATDHNAIHCTITIFWYLSLSHQPEGWTSHWD